MSGRRRKPRDPVKNLRQRGGLGKLPEGSGWLDTGGELLWFDARTLVSCAAPGAHGKGPDRRPK